MSNVIDVKISYSEKKYNINKCHIDKQNLQEVIDKAIKDSIIFVLANSNMGDTVLDNVTVDLNDVIGQILEVDINNSTAKIKIYKEEYKSIFKESDIILAFSYIATQTECMFNNLKVMDVNKVCYAYPIIQEKSCYKPYYINDDIVTLNLEPKQISLIKGAFEIVTDYITKSLMSSHMLKSPEQKRFYSIIGYNVSMNDCKKIHSLMKEIESHIE